MNITETKEYKKAQDLCSNWKYKDALEILLKIANKGIVSAKVSEMTSYCYSNLGEWEKCIE